MIILAKNKNPMKLHNELIAASLAPLRVENDLERGKTTAVNVWLTYPDDANMQVIQAIIDAHDPTLDPNIAIKQALAETDAGMARIAEDIYDLLVSEGKTFPKSVVDKIAERKALRAQLTP